VRKSRLRPSPALAAATLLASPALAQSAEELDARVAERIAAAGETYRAAPEQPACPGGAAGGENEIVVCGRDDSARWRVRSSRETDPLSRESLRDGLPRAPQLDRGSCKGQPGCMVGGWVPPPVYYIDLKAIPEAPAGSDAEKVARGEMADR
jgi:hypothetical protein